MKMRILYDIEYYTTGKNIEVEITTFHNPHTTSTRISGKLYFDLDLTEIKSKYDFSHKVRVCMYNHEEFGTIEITRFFDDPSKIWDRVMQIGLDEVEKEYQLLMREKKLERINEKY